MFKSGNVLSSNGRGIVREVRVAVFAVISRHIRRRDSLLFSLSLSLVLLLLLLRDALLLILMRVVFGWNICCELWCTYFITKTEILLKEGFTDLYSVPHVK